MSLGAGADRQNVGGLEVSVAILKHDICVNSRRNVDSEKSEPQMGFEPTALRDQVGCSNHGAAGDSGE